LDGRQWQLRALNLRSGSVPTLVSQSIKSERVPIYFEIHSKGSQIREKIPLREVTADLPPSLLIIFFHCSGRQDGWSDPPDFISGSNLSTGDTNTSAYTVVPFNQSSNPKSKIQNIVSSLTD
jgi:hypothetical protein